MVDMAKMKAQALERKRQHEEKELRKQLGMSKRPARRAPRSRTESASHATARVQATAAQQRRGKPKKAKRSVSRWALDALLVLVGLMVMLALVSSVLI